MSLGRLWRTVRHLTAEQWIFRFVCRGRRIVMRQSPGFSHWRIARAADSLPLPDISTSKAAAIGEIVLQLQTAVHGDTYRGAPHGKFTLLNRDYDFGGIDGISWRGEFHEGNNPLRRMNLAYMGYAVPLLAGGDPADLQAVRKILASLVAQNTWAEPGVFRDVWNAYTASHRMINLLSGLALYRKAGGPVDADAEREILGHARFCAAFIRGNLERDLQFNHLMKNYVALSAYAAMCEDVPSSLAILRNAVPKSIAQNILADGGHAERCPMYHILSLLDVKVFAASGLYPDMWQPLLDDTVRRMTAALPAMTLADGGIALMNDSWIGEAPRADAVVSEIAPQPVRELPLTGYVALSEGGDSVVFDCGPCGPDDNPGHAHADFLSIEATVDGKRFLVDTGVPTYTAGAARDRSRSAAAHNGPRLDGEEPIEFWKSFRVGRRGYAGLLDMTGFDDIAPLQTAGWQSGYVHLGTEIRRYAGLWPGRALLVADLWQGPSGNAATRFLIPGSWGVDDGGDFVSDGTRLTIRSLAGTMDGPRVAAHWTRFGVEEAAHRIDMSPAQDTAGARAAVLFTWDDSFEAPGAETLKHLFDRLTAAIPPAAKLG
ncbi:MAG: heparinase II/III domain-containing protein [Alphaproteobacteria bacterium]